TVLYTLSLHDALPILMTPTGMTKMVMSRTRRVVPMIMGRTAAFSGLKKSFCGMVEMKRQERPRHPLTMTLRRITASIARMMKVRSEEHTSELQSRFDL